MQLSDHSFGELTDLAAATYLSTREHRVGLGSIESGVNTGDIVERAFDAQPFGKNSDIGNETDVLHETVALAARVAAEDIEFAFERG